MPWARLHDLKTITCPTLVLHGEQDRIVWFSCGQLLAGTIPGARMTLLPNAGHQLFTDQPEAGSQVVLDFLKKAAA